MSCSALSLDRVLFSLAGSMVLLAALLTALVSPWWVLLAVFVGVNQWLYVIAGNCPASLVLGRVPCLGDSRRVGS